MDCIYSSLDNIDKKLANISKKIDVKVNFDDMATSLLRKELGSIDVLPIDSILDGLPEQNKNSVYALSSQIYSYPIFISILDRMIMEQINFMARQALDDNQWKFARATVNGISLVKEQFEKFDSEYKDLVKQKEPINPLDLI